MEAFLSLIVAGHAPSKVLKIVSKRPIFAGLLESPVYLYPTPECTAAVDAQISPHLAYVLSAEQDSKTAISISCSLY
jgi:hypothetical protein